jgi:hypothetical protein
LLVPTSIGRLGGARFRRGKAHLRHAAALPMWFY